MKKLMALAIGLGLGLVVSMQAWAAFGLGDLSFDGSLEVRGNQANNELNFGNRPNDTRGDTATRVRLGVNAQVVENVMGRIEFVRDTALYGTGATTINGEENLWRVQNAYVEFADLWTWNARLGRQYVGDAGDLVWNLSPKEDDNMTTQSIQGLTLKRKFGELWDLYAFTGKFSEDDPLGNTDANDVAGDVNMNAIQAGFNVVPGGKAWLGLVMGDDNNTSSSADANRIRIGRLGLNGGAAENFLTYRAEYLQDFGKFHQAGLDGSGAATDLKYQGHAIDLGVGVNPKDSSIGGFGLWANWAMASGDSNHGDDKDKSFHDLSVVGANSSDRYYGEIFGRSNTLGGGTPIGQGLNSADPTGTAVPGTQGFGLGVLNLGVKFKPAAIEKTWLSLNYYMFSRPEDHASTFGGGTTGDQGDKFGNEFDLAVGYDHSENVKLEAGYAMLNPDDALTGVNAAHDDTVTKLYARTSIKWGGTAAQ